MQVRKTFLADEDLINVLIYGCQNFGAVKAENYFEEINRTFWFLAENPLACPEYAEFEPPVRIHPHGKHLIVYRIEKDYILIIRVLHNRTNVAQQLDNSDLN
jgi:toxin ParE1/3/4